MFEEKRTRWGWHCLADDFAADIVRAAGIKPNDLVLDIGAGNGALTVHLASTGARVIAVELHSGRVDELKRRFDDLAQVKVVRENAAVMALPRSPYRVVANPPFSITSALIHKLLQRDSRLLSAHLVLQRAAARKFAVGLVIPRGRATHGFELKVERHLPRTAFDPPPRVDTSLLVIRRVRLRR